MARPATSSTHSTREHASTGFIAPEVNKIGIGDLRDALVLGYDDFLAKPSHLVFLCLFYPIAGLILCRLAFGYAVLPLIYPLIAGFALLGPFAAIGLYEISRRREAGQGVSWHRALDVFRSPGIGAILTLGGVLVVIFVAWLAAANTIYAMTFGNETPTSISGFISDLITTPAGWRLTIIGNGVGAVFAFIAFSISVVSFPLIIDRHVDVATAVATSLRAVTKNPVIMVLWGLIVAIGLVIGMAVFFVGLAIVMPILGHATWHLYRKVVQV